MTENTEKLQEDRERLRSAVRLALDSFETLVDPDPNKGILTYVKLQGEQQGFPLNETYDAVNVVIDLLHHDLAATEVGAGDDTRQWWEVQASLFVRGSSEDEAIDLVTEVIRNGYATVPGVLPVGNFQARPHSDRITEALDRSMPQ